MAIESLRVCKLVSKPNITSAFCPCRPDAGGRLSCLNRRRLDLDTLVSAKRCGNATYISRFDSLRGLPVDFSEDNIERAEDSRYVSKHVTFTKKVHCLEVAI
jgi:hypothetical protein